LAWAGKLWGPQAASAVKRVWLLEMTRLGDVVAATALLEPLRRAYPDAELTLLGSAAYAPLFQGGIHYRGLPPQGWAFLRAAWRLRRELCDPGLLLVSASPAARHSVLAWLSKPGRAAGYLFPAAGSPFQYDAPAPLQALGGGWQARALSRHGQHMVERDAEVLTLMGLSADAIRPSLSSAVPRLPRRVVLHAGANWDRRRWPLDRFVALAGALAAEDASVCLITAEAGEPGPLPSGVERREGLDLAGLRDLLAGASLYIGNDSGPLHLAAALGTPCLALFGPNLEERSGPWPLPGPGSPHHALHEEVPCRPCGQVTCIRPWDWCMDKLSLARVLAEARSMLH
jgi:ADP-heptose:LPS heptosyltransferase